ncbi:EscU/YscU/HrcU family type III secretion system export apparatus switch protein [Sphingosinicella sp.]|uniref:EscU/YscU/HrcU family type III secretion system export apparatus switch protein n=1 Tax=Sphingosinicella sp. TaxID=1917971 RepID=UPI00403817BA
MAEQEQNRSEEATPFKLRRAREKGTVARGMDLGFLGSMVALAGFILIAGETMMAQLGQTMRQALSAGMDAAADPERTRNVIAASYWPAVQSLTLLGGTIMAVVLLLEVLQLRGLVFTTHPLKPDFSRLNPAQGLKRLFSARMLQESLKSVLKLAAYAFVTFPIIHALLQAPARALADAQGVATSLRQAGLQLLFAYIGLALFFALIDQVVVRREFAKQMRMSRRELVRETREREGEPRLKQRRKQLHGEFVQQNEGLGKLAGSDLLVVNPEHFAVALTYDPARMDAPQVTAKARNAHALAFRREAFRLGLPIFENPPLARRLFKECAAGNAIGAGHYRAVAELYFRLKASSGDDHAR